MDKHIDQIIRLDDRPISKIGWWFEPEFNFVQVGYDGVSKIDVVEQYCGTDYSIYWVQVWRDDVICARYNARNVDCIFYDGDTNA